MIATIILLAMILFSLGIAFAKHGESKSNETYNFWATLIAAILELILYYYAGLFDNFKD